MSIPGAPDVDPNAWADAILKLIKGGGWAVFVLAALFISFKWWPWRKRGD